MLKDFSPRIRCAGRIKRSGKQGRLIIVKEGNRWFAHILVRAGVKPPKEAPRDI